MAIVCIVVSIFNVLVGLILAIACIIVPLMIIAIWVPRFYESVIFRIEDDHVYARFGVWWKKEKRVSYNLVSEVRLRQRPLQRKLRLVNIDVFTPATGTLKT